MIFALGFLFAGLGALVMLPALWRRAVRLSTRRLQMQLPLSMDEIAAERDHVRATAALAMRRTEQKSERLLAEKATALETLGRRTARLNALEDTHAALSALHRTASADLAGRTAELETIRAELGAAHQVIHDQDGQMENARRAHDALANTQARTARASEERRIAIAGLETRLAGLDMRLGDLSRHLAEKTAALEKLRNSIKTAMTERDLAVAERDAARIEVENAATLRARLAEKLKDLEERHQTALTERDEARRQSKAARTELARQNEDSARKSETFAELESRFQALRKRHAEQDRQLRRIESAHAHEMDDLRGERAALEGALQAARQEQARLREDMHHLTQARNPAPRRRGAGAGSSMARDGMTKNGMAEDAMPLADAAVLRDSLAQLAADIARLAAQSEGPASPILRLVRESPGSAPARSDLAERIRREQPGTVSTF